MEKLEALAENWKPDIGKLMVFHFLERFFKLYLAGYWEECGNQARNVAEMLRVWVVFKGRRAQNGARRAMS